MAKHKRTTPLKAKHRHERTFDLTGDGEYIIAWVRQDIGDVQDICIYGDPKGLRHFAELLMRVAEVDQRKLGVGEHDSFHCHFSTGLNTEISEGLPQITIGRSDDPLNPKRIRDDGAFFPAMYVGGRKTAITDPKFTPRSTATSF